MPEHNGVHWEPVGLWTRGEDPIVRNPHDEPFTDSQLEGADQIRIKFTLPDGGEDWATIHNDADYGWDELDDYVDDYIDESAYFG